MEEDKKKDLNDLIYLVSSVSKKKAHQLFWNSIEGLKLSPYYIWEGLKYAFSHSYIWKSLIIPFIIFIVISLAIFIILIIFVYPAQIVFIDNWVQNDDIISELYSFYLVLQETKFLSNIIFMIVLDVIRRSIYDKIFEKEAPELKYYSKLSKVKTKDRLIIVCYSVATTFVLDLITSPLLTIPLGGKILIALIKGWAVTWMYQAAFLASKGLNYPNQLRWIFKRFIAYELFGFIAALLMYIPILSWVFYWTNLCGAALWAMNISKAMEDYIEQLKEEKENVTTSFNYEKESLLKGNIL